MKHILLLSWLFVMAACSDDTLSVPDGKETSGLSARKVAETVVKSASSESFFDEGTRYRLWAYNDGGYMFTDGEPADMDGILARETGYHYILMDNPDHAKKLRDKFSVYGFTDGTATDPPVPDNGSENDPVYTFGYDPDTERGYPDCLRAVLDYDASSPAASSPVMPFGHIFSRVRVQVIQQDNGELDAGGNKVGRFDLLLHSVELSGVRSKAEYNVRTGTFSLPEGASAEELDAYRTLKYDAAGQKIIPAEAVITPFSESLVFPTIEADRAGTMTLRLTVSGSDAGRFGGQTDDEGNTLVEIPLTDWDGNPLEFKSNCSYMLRMVFTQDGVVRFTPEVYPWFDGEKDNSNSEDGWYEEQELGNTYLFDNLIWADRNLGAESADPMADFEKCVGFFYQFDRNVPYFPKDGNLTGGIKAYPVVYDPAGSRQAPDHDDNFRKFVYDLDENTDGLSFAFASNSGYNPANRLWTDIGTQPCPPGWRLPSLQELLGILPANAQAGNITFLKHLGFDADGFTGVDNGGGDFHKDDDVKAIYVHVPTNPDFPNYPENSRYVGIDNLREWGNGGDPYAGYSSEYIISRAYEDEVGRPAKELYSRDGGSTIWGTIYGIKKVGTEDAYRMRWRIENTDKQNKDNRYVLIIERYQADARDRLCRDANSPDYYRKYDWTRPVAVIYMPVAGFVSDGGWGGHDGTFERLGVETMFATSDDEPGTNRQLVLGIKITGSDRKNQYICPTVYRKALGVQVRMVRESTYQPDRN